MNQKNLSSFIWQVADLFRGDSRQPEYGKVTGSIDIWEFAYQEIS